MLCPRVAPSASPSHVRSRSPFPRETPPFHSLVEHTLSNTSLRSQGLTSGISFIGSPAYGFTHGLGQIFSATPYLVVIPIICFVLIPFFRALNVASSYVYLEFRFNRTIRVLACLLFLLRVVVYLSVVLLAPAVALSAVTGIPQWTVLLVCGVAATLYTLKGGMVRAGW